VLGDLPLTTDDRVLIDFRTADDAGVYRWEAGPALVQTVDFFTPIVDDPFVYGQIAAANSLSDVYAMGGRPLTALAIAGFPTDGPDRDVIKQIFLGGLDKLREAGVVLLGGHTVRDHEIKFGYAVTGAVDPSRVLSNAGARPGDALLLTKPLGTGLISTALKYGRAPEAAVAAATRSMTTLNRAAADALAALPPGVAHACTDVTGFGLLGHASEMAAASACTLRIDPARVPLLEGALALGRRNLPGGGRTNEEHFSPRVRGGSSLDRDLLAALYDPQTSGGLLVAVAGSAAARLLDRLTAAGVGAVGIGEVVPAAPDGALIVLG
jgi:selenide,water dikinase